jgi:hypothetical protein
MKCKNGRKEIFYADKKLLIDMNTLRIEEKGEGQK